jgi:hypothetical protein
MHHHEQQQGQAQDPHEQHQHHHEQQHDHRDEELIQRLRRAWDQAQRKDRKYTTDVRPDHEWVSKENDELVADVTKLIITCERTQNQLHPAKRHAIQTGQQERDRLVKQLPVRQERDAHEQRLVVEQQQLQVKLASMNIDMHRTIIMEQQQQQDVNVNMDVTATTLIRSSSNNNHHYRGQEQETHDEEKENSIVEESRCVPKAIFYFVQQQSLASPPHGQQAPCASQSTRRTSKPSSRGNVTCSISSMTMSSTYCSTGTANTHLPIRNHNLNCSNHEPVHLPPLLILQRHDESQEEGEEEQYSSVGGDSGFRLSSIRRLSYSLHESSEDETTRSCSSDETGEDHNDDCSSGISGSATEIVSCREEVTSTSRHGTMCAARWSAAVLFLVMWIMVVVSCWIVII